MAPSKSPIETLAPGNYVIGALIPETQVVIAAALTAPSFPGITYGENLQITGSGLAEPNFTDSNFGLAFFGPNLLVGAAPIFGALLCRMRRRADV